ncbi:MAG: hypothetical protein MUD08_01300 [Cytophagales bacterium]|jgi:hypothetical protein|nr:hypothetical protein [Cytophagales bacterium]
MKKEDFLHDVLPLFPEGEPTGQPETEAWKKSIPAQVFLNHYFGMLYHVRQSGEAYALANLPRFLEYQPMLNELAVDEIKKLLRNAWNTEYALRTTAQLGDEQYLRNALHWTFPQAYYSVLFGLRAFLATFGLTDNNGEMVRREVGRLVVRGYYPRPIAYYASGHYDDFTIHRLPLATYKPSLQLANEEIEAQAQIGQFLRTTRRLRAKGVRQQVQSNPKTALRNKAGQVLEKFSSSHWQQLTWRIGYTTYFDLLGRLRISANHREIERFVEAEIDFQLFHQCLLDLVGYLNFIHESYIAKAMGLAAYRELVAQSPAYASRGFVKERLDTLIEPLFGSTAPVAPLRLAA